MVPEDSSAARMPRPGAVIATATLFSSARFIALSSCQFSEMGPRRTTAAGRLGSFYSQHFDSGEGLALHPFEKGAAGGRYVGQALGDAGRIERGDRVASARHRDELA